MLLALAASPLMVAGRSFGASTTLKSAASATSAISATAATSAAIAQWKTLETGAGGKLGVAAIDTGSGRLLHHRGDQRFPFCSTFKVMAVAAILRLSMRDDALLARRINYTKDQMVAYSPITQQHIPDGMTIAGLCAAALQYSDNTAGNLLITELGGPAAVTAFARTIGNRTFRLDRWETALNTAIPGDPRDTATPISMARSLQRLLPGDKAGNKPGLWQAEAAAELAAPQREQLQQWMTENTTGAARIRAGVPTDWRVADKTGTGDYGTTNDIAMIWPTAGAPIVLALYFTQGNKEAMPRDDVIASATRIAIKALL